MRTVPVAAAVALFILDPLALFGPPPADLRLRVTPPPVVWIEGGWFTRGSSEADVAFATALCARGDPAPGFRCRPELFADEQPERRIWVSAYGIDRTEVSHAAWTRCVDAGECPPSRVSPADSRVARPEHPVTGIRWDEARHYCASVGGRLPTEAEWERAARGDQPGRRFPWGRFLNPHLANHGQQEVGLQERILGVPDGSDGYRYAAPVTAFPDGASPFGLLGMAGNAWEWTADAYEPDSYIQGDAVDPRGPPPSGLRVVRGGAWDSPPVFLRVTQRQPVPEGAYLSMLGFRCAYDPPPPR